MASLKSYHQRLVYLITYSRADIAKFPTKQQFADAVLEAWKSCGITISHWVVSIEGHAVTDSNDDMNMYHYHMALKLARRGRWLQVRRFLDETYAIQVHFSDNHNTYYSAYKYVTKEDNECLHSEQHPDLSSPPKTEQALASKKRKAREKNSTRQRKARKEKGLTVYDVSQLILAKKITTRLQLVCLAVEQNREGKSALAEFIANRNNKVNEALEVAKEFSEAEAKFLRSKKSRIQLLQEAKQGNCCEGCDGAWLETALKALRNNCISVEAFCTALYIALKKGRGKYQNIFIHGPANSGKTFILSPLKIIYHTFCNPATGTFAWLGAEEAEVIFLNDFRWSQAVIAWADLLQALEGDTVHFPAPKNFCKRDIELNKDTPFFATSDAPLLLIKGGSVDHANTEMMQVRWRFFHFWKPIPRSDQISLNPCASCFAKFVLENSEQESQD
jgi:hypothetical protein